MPSTLELLIPHLTLSVLTLNISNNLFLPIGERAVHRGGDRQFWNYISIMLVTDANNDYVLGGLLFLQSHFMVYLFMYCQEMAVLSATLLGYMRKTHLSWMHSVVQLTRYPPFPVLYIIRWQQFPVWSCQEEAWLVLALSWAASQTEPYSLSILLTRVQSCLWHHTTGPPADRSSEESTQGWYVTSRCFQFGWIVLQYLVIALQINTDFLNDERKALEVSNPIGLSTFHSACLFMSVCVRACVYASLRVWCCACLRALRIFGV